MPKRRVVISESSESEVSDEEYSDSTSPIVENFDSRVSAQKSKKGSSLKKNVENKQGNEISSSSSSIVTSFESIVSAQDLNKGSSRKTNAKNKKIALESDRSNYGTPKKTKDKPASSKGSVIKGRTKKRTTNQSSTETETSKSHSKKYRNASGSHVEVKSSEKKKLETPKKKRKPRSSDKNERREKRSSISKKQSFSQRMPARVSDSEDDQESRSSSENSIAQNYESGGGRPSPAKKNEVTPKLFACAERRKQAAPRRDRATAEIIKQQRETKLLIAKLPFSRVVREISESRISGLRWQVLAIQALQEAAEIYLVHIFEDALLCTLHRSRLTLTVADMRLARRIRSRYEQY